MAVIQTQIPMAASAAAGKPKLACFSFAAYAKTLIGHLKSLSIPILPGLTAGEFSAVETLFNFTFPPDLRSILREGLPVAHGFPNWRSSSSQQLHILINLPILSLSKEISQKKFWCESWGKEPDDGNEALDSAKDFLNKAPVLIPIYRNCYIPSAPSTAGNPVFYINGGDIRVMSFDVAGFFQEIEFLEMGISLPVALLKMSSFNVPAWAATEARRIEVWTEVAERGRRRMVARRETLGWWSGGGELGVFLEEVFWRLRDGGWREEEVKEMMVMMDGGDERKREAQIVMDSHDGVTCHLRRLSLVLLRAGWSTEDVLYSLGFQNVIQGDDDQNRKLMMKQHSLDV